jgi:hypothetical protein
MNTQYLRGVVKARHKRKVGEKVVTMGKLDDEFAYWIVGARLC